MKIKGLKTEFTGLETVIYRCFRCVFCSWKGEIRQFSAGRMVCAGERILPAHIIYIVSGYTRLLLLYLQVTMLLYCDRRYTPGLSQHVRAVCPAQCHYCGRNCSLPAPLHDQLSKYVPSPWWYGRLRRHWLS